MLLAYEVTRGMAVTMLEIETPLAKMQAPVLDGKKIVLISILRAGGGILDGMLQILPSARVGHIGLYRDPQTRRPVEYFVKLPDPEGRLFFILDPMLATGHSASAAVDILNRRGIPDSRIRLMALVAAPEGVRTFRASHPDLPIYAAALDERLNDHAYIVPGLGDAGDRLFGTR